MAKGPWHLAGKARNDFADMIEPLSDEQLDSDTLCDGWTARHIAGHLVWVAEMKMPKFMLDMAKAGFNYDKMADRVARANAEGSSKAELIARLRSGATNPAPAPGFVEMIPVGDVSVHTQDVRRGLGLPGALDPDVLRMALEFITTHKIGMDLADVGEGMRFEATDVDWSFGTGDTVSGPGETILMTLAGRITGELDGL